MLCYCRVCRAYPKIKTEPPPEPVKRPRLYADRVWLEAYSLMASRVAQNPSRYWAMDRLSDYAEKPLWSHRDRGSMDALLDSLGV